MKMDYILKLNILLLFFGVMFVSCSRNIDIVVENYENSNLNSRGDNVPITAVVYKLNDIKKFQDASVIDLLNREDIILGKDKIDSIKIQVVPNEKVSVTTINDNEVAYIGVLVVYKNLENKKLKSHKKVKDINGSGDKCKFCYI